MTRIVACGRDGTGRVDLDERTASAVMRERVNGEHSLEIETTQPLAEGNRLLNVDATGKVREWVIDEPEESHVVDDGTVGTYGATWSMQYDLSTVKGGVHWVSLTDGAHEPIGAAAALDIALSDQTTWERGNVTVATQAACSLYAGSTWDYLKKLLNVFGGEMEPRIVCDAAGNVTHRYVDWLAHVGATEVRRRFDFGEDCTSISRTESPGPRYSRVRPLAGGAKTDEDGVDYSDHRGIDELTSDDMAEIGGWALNIESYTYECGDLRFRLGTDYIEDVAATQAFDYGNHPTKTVTYSVTETKSGPDDMELFVLAAAEVLEHTRPRVTYAADVEQLSDAGMDVHGVELGDEVHVVDRTFAGDGLRIEARVVERVVNLLDETDVQLTIGEPLETLAQSFKDISEHVQQGIDSITSGGTLVYVRTLIDAINAEMNATGGWVYDMPGEGIYVYDHVVSDPSVGAEASKATHIGGGGIRVASGKTAQGAFDYTSLMTGDGLTAELVTAANITAGFIRDADGTLVIDLDDGVVEFEQGIIRNSDGQTYWNLTTGEFHAANAYLSGTVYATSGEIGGFTIANTRIYNDAMSLSSAGIRLTSVGATEDDQIIVVGDKFDVGIIGTNKIANVPGTRSLSFDLEYRGAYMTWAVKRTSGASVYTMKLTYYNRSVTQGGYSYLDDTLYASCPFVFRDVARFEGEMRLYRTVSSSAIVAKYLVAHISQSKTLDDVSGLTLYPDSEAGNFVGFGNTSGTPRVAYVATSNLRNYDNDTFYVRCASKFAGAASFGSSVNFSGSISVTVNGSDIGTIYTGRSGTYTIDGRGYVFKRGILVDVE